MKMPAFVLLFCLLAVPLFAQTREGRLLVTVVDQTRAVIPNATVIVTGIEDGTKAAAIAPAQTSGQGLATIAGLTPGRYEVRAEFPGFQQGRLGDVRVRAGDNRHVIVLPLQKVEQEVTVARDAQAAAAERNTLTFGSALTREQIDALSDDPEEMRRQLLEMAGGEALIRVDSFEGAALPAKSQIKSIHITRDQFAAENHNAGGLFIDIITQPGLGAIRGGTNLRFRNGSLSGRSPFTPIKGPENIKNFGVNFGGSLIRNRSSFSLGVNGMRSYDTPNLNAALPRGVLSTALPLRAPRNNILVNGLWDLAVTPDQTLRVSYNHSSNTNKNLGIGEYSLPERAYSTENGSHQVRIQHAGPLKRRFFTNTRVMINRTSALSRSAVEAPTIHVIDAFTSGGQQVAGGRRSTLVNLASDLDYVRGIHSVRTGILLDTGWHGSDDRSNYLGTYTFESLDAYEAGTPRSYTRRIGDPYIRYNSLQAGLYVQDDIRVNRSLTLSPGLRYEAQAHVDDAANFGPRFGLTWAPFRNGGTTLRASAGIFNDWMASGTYEQILRVDGFRQQEINVVSPSYPEPGLVGDISPINRYLLGDVRLVTTRRLSAGIDQRVTGRIRVNSTYAYMRGGQAWRGENLNAPEDGVRPDPAFANVVQVVSDGSSRQHTLSGGLNVSFANQPAPIARDGPPALFGPQTGPRFDLRRSNINVFYTFGWFRNNTDGPFGLAPNGDIEDEWGPANGDVRHRFNIGFSSSALRNLSANLNLNGSTGAPYSIRTGVDDNGDLVFNDRPAGVGRNTERTALQWNVNVNLNYSIAFGQGGGGGGPIVGIMIPAPGAAPTVMTGTGPATRYRLGFFVQMQNVTNHSNFGGYSGVLTSPFFGQPTNVLNPRKIDFGVNFGF
jgi:hypothetical protein